MIPDESGWLALAGIATLEEGINPAEKDGIELVIVKKEDDLSVFAGRCLHQEAPMAQGILEENHIVCGKHLWKYRLDSGALEGEPGIFLRKFETRRVGDQLEIRQAEFSELQTEYAAYDEEEDEDYRP